MITYKISHILISELIKELSAQMETSFEDYYGEYLLQIPEHVGKGTISGINFPNGVGLVQFDLSFLEDTELVFECDSIHPLKMVYCSNDHVIHRFTNDSQEHFIESNKAALFASDYKHGHIFRFETGNQIQLKLLDINREMFASNLTFPIEGMDELYYTILGDTKAIRSVFHHSYYSLHLHKIEEQLNNFQGTGLSRTAFLGAKSLEMLCYVLELYKDDQRDASFSTVIRSSEASKIKEVLFHIDSQLTNLSTVEALAKHVGITEAKLQEGFKLMFNKTVNEYIQSRRLEEALRLLGTTDMNISEIVYAVGLSSRSHFSKIFKAKYGISPSKIERNTSVDIIKDTSSKDNG